MKDWAKSALVALGIFIIGALVDQSLVRMIGRPYWQYDRLSFFWLGFPLVAAVIAIGLRFAKQRMLSRGFALAGFIPSFLFFLYMALYQYEGWTQYRTLLGWPLFVPLAAALLNAAILRKS